MVVEQTHQTKHRKWSHTMKSEEKHNVTDKEICSPCEGHTVTFRHGQIRRWHVQALLFTNKESRLLLWGCFILLQSCVVKWITNPVVIKNLHQATMPTSKSELRRFGLNVMQDVIPIHVTLLLRKPFFFFGDALKSALFVEPIYKSDDACHTVHQATRTEKNYIG